MKKAIFLLILLLGLLEGFAQTSINFIDQGGGAYVSEQTEACLTNSQRTAIQERLKTNISQLQSTGVLPLSIPEDIVTFDWPLRVSPELDFHNYFAITGYLDHDNTNGVRDFNCGSITYDGHNGIDYITWPFPWYVYNNNLVEVVAAEAGIIIGKDDNQEDDNCNWEGNWNAVYIQHIDGSVAWYGHLKKNSLTNKEIGQPVSTGEYLGFIASSGFSTTPHLHLEIYDNNNNLIDPYAGNCNNLSSDSWWTDQNTYRSSEANALLTHDAEPMIGCPAINEAPNFSNNFSPGQPFYVGAYFQNQTIGDPSIFQIRKPDNSVWNGWVHHSPDSYYVSYWWWTFTLPDNGPFGTWTLELEYNEKTYSHEFNYFAELTSTEIVDLNTKIEFNPNPTTGIVDIQGIDDTKANIKIIDRLGRIISSSNSHHRQIDLSKSPSGLYFVVIEIEGQRISKRIVKI